MPRPQRSRRICREPIYKEFAPLDPADSKKETVSKENKAKGEILLSMDEYEVIRMVDFIGLTHEQCAAHMGISRTTVTEVYEKARKKLADMIVNGKKLNISGGNYSVCQSSASKGVCGGCGTEGICATKKA